MSGIYIPDMKMPASCSACPLEVGQCCCGAMPVFEETYDFSDTRRPDCPLIPVPAHGMTAQREEGYWLPSTVVIPLRAQTGELVNFGTLVCSNCENIVMPIKWNNYCPCCGSRNSISPVFGGEGKEEEAWEVEK